MNTATRPEGTTGTALEADPTFCVHCDAIHPPGADAGIVIDDDWYCDEGCAEAEGAEWCEKCAEPVFDLDGGFCASCRAFDDDFAEARYYDRAEARYYDRIEAREMRGCA